MTWLDEAIDEYFKFIKKHTKVAANSYEWSTITTPFLNVFNDCIELYCKNIGDKIILSDGKETIENLSLCGVNFSHSKTRKSILSSILLNYGITEKNDELFVETSIKRFGQAKHNLICCIMEISDMYMLAKPTVASVFKEDISEFFKERKVIATRNFIAKGSTGIEYNFAFQIAGMSEEILVDAFNTINHTNVARFVFDWSDIQETRQKTGGKSVRGLAIINDSTKKIDNKYLDALSSKGTDYILFSERFKDKNLKKLKPAA